MNEDKSFTKLLGGLFVGMLLITGFMLMKLYSIQAPSLANLSGSVNLGAIFLTGLITGGLTCLAVQGGLLASTLAQREEEKLKDKTKSSGNALPILTFLGAKLVAYTILGILLGALGSVVELSLTARVALQFGVAIFMIGTALNLLKVHPIFRYFAIQPPRFLTRLVRNQSKSKDMFAPGLLGALTVFIPCGTTQAMMALAIASASPVLGATILFTFVLGTSPVFFGLGYFATKLSESLHEKFMKVAAFAIILLALYNLNGAIALTGSRFTLENLTQNVAGASTPRGQVAAAVSNPTITIQQTGYEPNNITVKAGSQVTLKIVNQGGQGCTQAFTIPKFNIQKVVPMGKSDTVTFTAPKQAGPIPFMCSMGMFRGVINVIET